MKTIMTLLATLALSHTTMAVNDYPIVLIPGFGGWERKELHGYLQYFGGSHDFQQMLVDEGYETYTAVGGPFSSVWDRTVEIYTQLKGGTVDYGKAHSEKHGHDRFSETYEGLYPDMGTIDENGNIRKVHLIAHSMGGQDCRLFTHLLNIGAPEEVEATGDATSTLFKGKNDWIASCTTISSPHDGTTLSGVFEDSWDPIPVFATDVLMAIAASTGIAGHNEVFDFHLDQWGLTKKDDETYTTFLRRVFKSNAWKSSKDMAIWDLSPEGARDLNDHVQTIPHVHYFTLNTMCTKPSIKKSISIPIKKSGLSAPKWIVSALMGTYSHEAEGDVTIDASWHPNDGSVNTVSMSGPTIGKYGDSSKIIKHDTSTDEVNDKCEAGVYHNILPILDGWKHVAIIGLYQKLDAYPLYQAIAKMVHNEDEDGNMTLFNVKDLLSLPTRVGGDKAKNEDTIELEEGALYVAE